MKKLNKTAMDSLKLFLWCFKPILVILGLFLFSDFMMNVESVKPTVAVVARKQLVKTDGFLSARQTMNFKVAGSQTTFTADVDEIPEASLIKSGDRVKFNLQGGSDKDVAKLKIINK